MSPFVESLDSDSDGIRDTVDFCIYAKETYNNYQDKTVALMNLLLIYLQII